jgi:hypothetical protein
MPYSAKDWKDFEAGNTPLSATAIEDLEGRLAAYIDSQVTAAVSGITATKGAPSGIATLDSAGVLASTQRPASSVGVDPANFDASIRHVGTDCQDVINAAAAAGKKWINLSDNFNYDNTAGNISVPADMKIHGKGRGTLVTVRNLNNTNVLDVGQRAELTDMRIYVAAHATSPALGSDPSGNVVRSEWHSHSTGKRLLVEGFWTPFMLDEDHITIEECETVACQFGMIRVAGGSTGNLHTRRNYFTGCTVAGHWVAWGAKEDSWCTVDDHFGFAPFGLLAETNASQQPFSYINLMWLGSSIESWGNRAVASVSRSISGVMIQPRTGMWDLGNGISGPQYYWAGTTDAGLNNHNYAFTSPNVTGWPKSGNGNLFDIYSAGGDQYNGAFIGGGSIGVFQTL